MQWIFLALFLVTADIIPPPSQFNIIFPKELERKLADCESRNPQDSSIVAAASTLQQTTIAEQPTTISLSLQNAGPTDKNFKTYEFPATNKALAERISAYQNFISEYIVQAQIEKTKAVADAEKKTRLHYEALLEKMKQ